ncbi:hypothetical protein VTK26DRAFT_399 [Humicola hyalothermophila]
MLTIESFFSSSFIGQLRAIVHMSPPRDKPAPPQREPSTMTVAQNQSQTPRTRRRIRMRITRPDPGSLYDIMHDHAGTALFVIPICWTDLHSRLLGVRFIQRPAIAKPVPDLISGQWYEPSRMAQNLTSELHTLVREESTPARAFTKNRAIKHVMSTLFPATMSHPKSGAELNLYFGHRVFKKVVRVPCLWKAPSSANTSFDSCPTLPSTSFSQQSKGGRESVGDYAPNTPILAYINKSQLASVRNNLYGVMRGPGNAPNEPVAGLQRLRSKLLRPANPDHDPYIVAILLAMAQAHFYQEPRSRPSSQSQSGSQGGRKPIRIPPPQFRDIKVQVITHDEGNSSTPNFVVYTALVTVDFLNRFMFPHKAPASSPSQDAGMEISMTPVPCWPILGLKERLAKALGREIAGDPMFGDPDHIGLWDALLEPQPQPQPQPQSQPEPELPTTPSSIYRAVNLKRRRGERSPLSEVLNSSFEEDPPTSSDDRPVLSPAAKRRRTARRVNTLEVC